MPDEELPLIDALRGLAMLQQELLRLALFVASEGPATFEGEAITCSLNDGQRRTSAILAMAAGQSVETLLRMAKLRGIPVRDAYPTARSVVESFVNASYLLAESDEVAARAIRYMSYASWRHHNRKLGSGEFAIEVRSDPDPAATLTHEFPEFSGKGKGMWTSLDIPSRIRRVGELAGRRAGSRLLAAYGLIYSLSSEIVHGSPFGASFFYSAHRAGEETTEAFVAATVRHLEEILIAVLHANCGYLAAFFGVQEMKAPLAAEEKLFARLLDLSTKPSSSFPTKSQDANASGPRNDASPFGRGEAQRQATKPGPVVRGTFSPARAWRPAIGPASPQTLGVTKAIIAPPCQKSPSESQSGKTRRFSAKCLSCISTT